jgi:hypothetical protein
MGMDVDGTTLITTVPLDVAISGETIIDGLDAPHCPKFVASSEKSRLVIQLSWLKSERVSKPVSLSHLPNVSMKMEKSKIVVQLSSLASPSTPTMCLVLALALVVLRCLLLMLLHSTDKTTEPDVSLSVIVTDAVSGSPNWAPPVANVSR